MTLQKIRFKHLRLFVKSLSISCDLGDTFLSIIIQGKSSLIWSWSNFQCTSGYPMSYTFYISKTKLLVFPLYITLVLHRQSHVYEKLKPHQPPRNSSLRPHECWSLCWCVSSSYGSSPQSPSLENSGHLGWRELNQMRGSL